MNNSITSHGTKLNEIFNKVKYCQKLTKKIQLHNLDKYHYDNTELDL